jgi:hypothetical protein
MVALAKSRGDIAPDELAMDDEDRAAAAALVWGNEKPTAVLVLLACWLVKVRLLLGFRRALVTHCLTGRADIVDGCARQVYFSLILYSFAAHLRHNTYRALPLTTTPVPSSSGPISSSTPSHSRAPSRQAVRSAGPKTSGEEVFSWEEGDESKDAGDSAGGSKRSTEGAP